MADTKKSEPEVAGHEGESAPPASEPASVRDPGSISRPPPSTEPYSIEVRLSDALTGYRRAVEQIENDLNLFLRGRIGLHAEQEVFEAHFAAQWREAYVAHGLQFLVQEIYPLIVRAEDTDQETWERAVRSHTRLAITQWQRLAAGATPGVVWRRADDGGHLARAWRQLEKRAAEAEEQKAGLGKLGAEGVEHAAGVEESIGARVSEEEGGRPNELDGKVEGASGEGESGNRPEHLEPEEPDEPAARREELAAARSSEELPEDRTGASAPGSRGGSDWSVPDHTHSEEERKAYLAHLQAELRERFGIVIQEHRFVARLAEVSGSRSRQSGYDWIKDGKNPKITELLRLGIEEIAARLKNSSA